MLLNNWILLLFQTTEQIDTVFDQMSEANPTTMVGYSLLVIFLVVVNILQYRENKKLRRYQRKMDEKDLEFKQNFISILTSVKMHLETDGNLQGALHDLTLAQENLTENIKETLAILRKKYG